MISNDISNTETVRNVFIIDDRGVVRVILVYPMNIGRCIPEILRTIEALQLADCNKASTPANWCPGEPLIVSPPQTFTSLEERIQSIQKNKNGLGWYLSFKESDKCCNRILAERKVEQMPEKSEHKD